MLSHAEEDPLMHVKRGHAAGQMGIMVRCQKIRLTLNNISQNTVKSTVLVHGAHKLDATETSQHRLIQLTSFLPFIAKTRKYI